MTDFDTVSRMYGERSLVQRGAADALLGLLGLSGDESVLDVGCGPGHITAAIAKTTTGRVVGVDVSTAMIEEARSAHPEIEFVVTAAEELGYREEFDVVFCNSVLQWLREPDRGVGAMVAALKKGGTLGVASPATSRFSPYFDRVMGGVLRREELARVFRRWRSPWFFLEDAKEYEEFFEQLGLETRHLRIETLVTECSTEEAFGVYMSGARQGFANPDYYDTDVDERYLEEFHRAVREEMESDAVDGVARMEFNRLFYVGCRS